MPRPKNQRTDITVEAVGMDEDEAARWAIRLDTEDPLPVDLHAELDQWLAGREGRSGALLRAQATLAYLDRARALAGEPTLPVDRQAPVAAQPEDDGMKRRRFLVGAAASLVVASGTGALWHAMRRAQKIDTAVGEIRHLVLEDGSVATVNTGSRLAVAMQADRRTVRIHHGEAWFQVASDKERPFVVEAGGARVQAIGTAFSVRRWDDGAEVLVTEGVVETWIVGKEDGRQRITAGSKGLLALADPKIEVTEAPQEIDQELAWRSGELVLKGQTLDYAAAEMNRYNTRKIEIGSPELGRTELVGFFRTNEPEKFAQAVRLTTGARIIEQGDTIRLEQAAP
jgi:transmembrane sensor